ncbi:LAMI_0E01420g1_1 [Lachancea mirantina]|uniref:LAMI_0E01420g1_1 n=1 Tax=Lachancea mirantina TaxID=1230905 RepID=A0A1G4JIT3_9SACH|nr:LAMI_0E01420g1_1 [Lachancea mirantina]
MNFSMIEPKVDSTASSTASKVLKTSRQWDLPPRLKPGRRPGQALGSTARGNNTRDDVRSVNGGNSSLSSLQSRKVKNRDAQRAFRDRKASEAQELRDSLSKWKNRCEMLQNELKNSVDESHKVQTALKARITELEKELQLSRQENFSHRNEQTACSCKESSSVANPTSTILDPVLQEKINNLVPMKAVAWQRTGKRTRHSGTKPLPKFRRLNGQQVAPAVEVSSLSDPLSFEESGGQGCGFCSEASTCLCKDAA